MSGTILKKNVAEINKILRGLINLEEGVAIGNAGRDVLDRLRQLKINYFVCTSPSEELLF